MKFYRTNYNSFQKSLGTALFRIFIGPWKIRSISLIALLTGFYIVSTFTSYFLDAINQRIIVALAIYIFLELCIRFRNMISYLDNNLLLVTIDNLRIGITYGIVLEAFKLGS